MEPEQIAINTVCTGEAALEETLAAYAAAGFGKVEFALPPVKRWLAAGRRPADLKRLLDDNGLRCIGGFETTVLCFADDAQRRANSDLHAANADLLAALGGGIIVAGTDGPAEKSLDALKVIGQAFRDLAERIDPAVALAVEFNWSPIVKSLRSAALVAEAADHGRVGIVFDPAHYHCTPSRPEDLAPDVVRRIIHVHVDDMADKPGDLCDCNWDRVMPGEGILDLPGLLARIEGHGYRGSFSIELFNRPLRALPVAEAARRCYQAMRAMCG